MKVATRANSRTWLIRVQRANDSRAVPDVMFGAVSEAGCLVVHGMADANARAAVNAELAPHVESAHADEDNPEDF